jgi:hypothetical protein
MARSLRKKEPKIVYFIKSEEYFQGPYFQKPSLNWNTSRIGRLNAEIVSYNLIKNV